ncbi:MAG: flagellar biosynthesis anti-sigma factor FlgM [Tepidiformaceae bacterium]
MSHAHKTPGTTPTQGVVYDLAARRRQTDEADVADDEGVGESAGDLVRARRGVEATPEARAKRVAELKAQIANGTYNPDAEEIARKMLERGF